MFVCISFQNPPVDIFVERGKTLDKYIITTFHGPGAFV